MRAVVPMVFALMTSLVYADAMGWVDGPNSLMHPKSHRAPRSSIEITLEIPKAGPELPPAVTTMNIEWLAKINRATLTGDTGDGEEEKRLFWHTIWGDNPGVPFTGWGDPDPLNYIVWSATHSPDNPGFHFITDPPPVRNAATEQAIAPPILPTIQPKQLADRKIVQTFQDPLDILSGEADKNKDNSKSDPPPSVVLALCLVDPALPQCIAALTSDPTDPITPPVVTIPGGPTDPVIVVTVPPIIGVPVDPVISGTAAPEPSTWAMLVIGFFGIAFMAYSKQRRLVATENTQSCQV